MLHGDAESFKQDQDAFIVGNKDCFFDCEQEEERVLIGVEIYERIRCLHEHEGKSQRQDAGKILFAVKYTMDFHRFILHDKDVEH
jgi:hypothetical protein